MDNQLNTNPQEPQRMSPPPVRPVSDVVPPGNLPFEISVITGPSEPKPPAMAPAPEPVSNLAPKASSSSQPEVTVRTMEADLKSLKSGGPVSKAQAVLPSALKEIKEVPETVNQVPGQIVSEQPKGGPSKTLLMILGVVVVGGVLGLVGYYYVYPLAFNAGAPEAPATPAPIPTPSLPIRLNHVSYFKADVPKTRVEFRALSSVSITEALSKIERVADGTLKEAVILDASGGQVYFKDYLSKIIPITDTDKNLISEALAQDFTAFLYYDANGAWPGYVAKVKSATDADKLRLSFLPVFELFDPGSFYLNSAITFQPFKDGKYKESDTRYAVGSVPGSSFNYAFIGDYLVFSTSFNGFKAAVMALGL